MLEIAYLIVIEDLKKRLLSDRQIIAMCITAGAKDLTLPDIDEERKKFDDWLEMPDIKKETSDNEILLNALGLR